MGTFLVFIMKSTCCLALFYLFYRLLLSRDTFHCFNRMALLGVIAFSVAIPFVRVVADEPTAVQRTVLDIEQLLQMAGTPVTEEAVQSDLSIWLTALFAVYVIGCLFFAGRFLYSIGKIVRLIRSGETAVLEGGMRLVVVEQTIPPFSWMKYIVISRIDMEESGAEILAHEQAHIKACHSVDMWLSGCCAVLHWFNPAVWLLKQELQNVHEYEADESVIAHGVDAKHYQLLLIKKAVGAQRFTSIANSFNHSKLKKRITMMLKQKSNPWGRLKYLYVLPLATVAVVTFARPDISRGLEKIAEAQFAENLASQQNKKKTQVKKQETVEGKLDAEEVKKKAEVMKLDSVKMKQEENTLEQGAKEDDRNAKKDIAEAGKEVGVDKQSIKKKLKVEMAVEGEPRENIVVVGYGSMNQLNGKVFDITRKDTLLRKTLDLKPNRKSVKGVRYLQANPLVVVDGVEYSEGLDNIDPEDIESISVLKNEQVKEMYGVKGAAGVILITTKKAK